MFIELKQLNLMDSMPRRLVRSTTQKIHKKYKNNLTIILFSFLFFSYANQTECCVKNKNENSSSHSHSQNSIRKLINQSYKKSSFVPFWIQPVNQQNVQLQGLLLQTIQPTYHTQLLLVVIKSYLQLIPWSANNCTSNTVQI